MSPTGWPAPAKLNLFLHIVGRRPDGYHLLQTVFQFLNWGDTLYFTVRSDGEVRRLTDLSDVPVDRDLTVLAARVLQQETGTALGVDIRIDKILPMGAGLGGGSSNAATTLVALNQLWGLGLSTARLMALALTLGADVPVFVGGRAAWAEGVGEQLTPLDHLYEPWYLVLIPPSHVTTAEIFRAPELTRDARPLKIRAFLSGQGTNVCEPVVRVRYPQVAQALDWLSRHAKARMSGTGAAVFAAFDTEATARQVLAQAPSAWRGVVTKGLNESPLLKF